MTQNENPIWFCFAEGYNVQNIENLSNANMFSEKTWEEINLAYFREGNQFGIEQSICNKEILILGVETLLRKTCCIGTNNGKEVWWLLTQTLIEIAK